jgi:hypothetical protein
VTTAGAIADARSWWEGHRSQLEARAKKRRDAVSEGETALTVAVDARSLRTLGREKG